MEILNYFSDNHAQLLYILAGLALVIELTVLGMSGPLLFFSIGCFITAILSNLGVVSGWESEVFSVGFLTCVSAALLWKPLKRFQNKEAPQDSSSDMIGREVLCVVTINKREGAIRYSGINWTARIAPTAPELTVQEGDHCKIISVEGNVMIVQALPKH